MTDEEPASEVISPPPGYGIGLPGGGNQDHAIIGCWATPEEAAQAITELKIFRLGHSTWDTDPEPQDPVYRALRRVLAFDLKIGDQIVIDGIVVGRVHAIERDGFTRPCHMTISVIDPWGGIERIDYESEDEIVIRKAVWTER